MRVIVAGAARGAWIGVLAGVVLDLIVWLLVVALRNSPGMLPAMTGAPPHEVWRMILTWMSCAELVLFIWIIIASSLSGWWRALR